MAKIETFEAEYALARPKYEAFSLEVCRIVKESLNDKNFVCQSLESRAKTVASFKSKSLKQKTDGSKKYKNPLSEITDLSGVRVICYTLNDVQNCGKIIEEIFEILEKTDVGDVRYNEGKFGYQSIHYLIGISEDRLKLNEYKKFEKMICEIQIRTVLQHAWAEIEHDIRYKSTTDIPKNIERKFVSLAGLLEIADREFQSLKDDELKLKNSVYDSLNDDLTLQALSSTHNTETRHNSKETEFRSVRDLVRQQDYKNAIVIYDRKIELSPKMDTLYLGRARAKFLMGDVSGAKQDVDTALNLNPNNAVGHKLGSLIRGDTFPDSNDLQSKNNSDNWANELTKQGNSALECGDGVRAFELYSQAQLAGASRPFSMFNKALSCLVADDIQGAKDHLGILNSRIGTPMSVSIESLNAVISIIEGNTMNENIVKNIKYYVSAVDEFSFQMSPLRKFESAILKKYSKTDKYDNIQIIFNLLREG